MPRMPTIAAERRAARAELRATRRDAAMTTAEQAARTERLRELLRQGVQRHRRLVNVARDMHEQLQEAAHARAALVVENAALVAERNALRQNLADRDAEVALLEEQRDTAEDARARLAQDCARLAADRDALYAELEEEQAARDADRREWINAEKAAASNSTTAVDFMLQRDRARLEVDRLREELQLQRLRAETRLRKLEEANRVEAQAATRVRLERDVALCQVREFYAKYNGLDKETLTVRLGPNRELIIGTTGPDAK